MIDSEPARHLALPGTRNLRDVGGYPAGDGRHTRWRTLLRTDALDLLPADSQRALLELGLRQVIDLRWPTEIEQWPSVFATSDHVRYRPIPLLQDDATPYGGLPGTYRHMFDGRAGSLVEVVRALIGEDGLPAVIGCAAGKDRTGVTIALVLAAVGVPRAVIVEDYTLTRERFVAPVDDPRLTDWRRDPLELDCLPEYIDDTLEHLDQRHGGAQAFLRRNGMTDAELLRLRALLTEPASPRQTFTS
jgi:protein-tyrosine phosphatase